MVCPAVNVGRSVLDTDKKGWSFGNKKKNVFLRKEKPSTQQAKRREAFRYTACTKKTSIRQLHSRQLLNAECANSAFYVYLIKLTRACHKLG